MNLVTVALAVLLIPMLIGLCAHLLAGLLGVSQRLASLVRAPWRPAHARDPRRRALAAVRARTAALSRPTPEASLPLVQRQSPAALSPEPHSP